MKCRLCYGSESRCKWCGGNGVDPEPSTCASNNPQSFTAQIQRVAVAIEHETNTIKLKMLQDELVVLEKGMHLAILENLQNSM